MYTEKGDNLGITQKVSNMYMHTWSHLSSTGCNENMHMYTILYVYYHMYMCMHMYSTGK